MAACVLFYLGADARPAGTLEVLFDGCAVEPGGDTGATMPVRPTRGVGPGAHSGVVRPRRKMIYLGHCANPIPIRGCYASRHHDAVPFTAPVNLYRHSTSRSMSTRQALCTLMSFRATTGGPDHTRAHSGSRRGFNPDPRHCAGSVRALTAHVRARFIVTGRRRRRHVRDRP